MTKEENLLRSSLDMLEEKKGRITKLSEPSNQAIHPWDEELSILRAEKEGLKIIRRARGITGREVSRKR